MTSKPSPLACHVFNAAGGTCAYDVATNEIYRVDPVLAALLSADGDARHGAAAVARARRELYTAQREEGIFRDGWPELIAACDIERAPAVPGHLTLSLTEQCNLRCAYCPHTVGRVGERPHGDVHMSRGTAIAAIRSLAEADPPPPSPTVSFYGGEPLLRFDLIRELVEDARARTDWPRLRFIIDTNGTLIDDEVARFVVEHEVSLQISLDGPAEVHDRHRCGHAAVLEGVRRVLALDRYAAHRLAFVAVLAPPYDLEHIEGFFREFSPYEEFGVAMPPHVRVLTADLEGTDLAEATAAHAPRLAEEMAAARGRYVRACAEGRHDEASPVLLSLFDGSLIRFHHRRRGPLMGPLVPGGCCRPGGRKLHVRADGQLQPCERVGTGLVLGEIGSGVDPAKAADLERAFHDQVAPRCRTCWAVRLCDLCFVSPARSGEIPETACAAVRRRVEATLRLHVELATRGPDALAFLEGSTVS